ncbi:DNA repair protein RecN [Nakamurella aerolata]|uniref:DNA repair protein RecN n=1 Tax=Nakamurella aerolata TaxID=1656892 RepID=A0A849A9C8_9ACTN|nr:DNA repair protein RecN [Nakamurella aerolata]
MLSELRISGLGVIADAGLNPHPGFTVVTGETGAGKTMVVTALGLVAGGRADAARVRVGADRAVVEARWEATSPAAERAITEAVESVGGDVDDDGSAICVRTVSAEGRSRAHLGGRSVPLGALASISQQLLAIHGQQEAISLLSPSVQRRVLDRYAGLDTSTAAETSRGATGSAGSGRGGPLAGYRTARAGWLAARAELADRVGRARELAQREQLLRMGLTEIDALAPQPGEDAELIATVKRLENVDGMRTAAAGAAAALSGVGGSGDPDAPTAAGLADTAARQLAGSGDDELAGMVPAVQQAVSVLTEVGADLAGYLDTLDADPAALDRALTRQAELRALTRKYGADVDEVLAWAEAARTELASLDTSDAALGELRQRVDTLAAEVAAAAAKLTARRRKAAAALSKQATTELKKLAMSRSALRVAVTGRAVEPGADPAATDTPLVQIDGQWWHAGQDGVDHVEILLTPHPGSPELPITKGASGGELSRVMLALEVVLAGADTVGTLVFDEVDAGVGGRAATEIGSRLAALAKSHQVIVVTHLAQVAAYADRQYVVDGAAGTRKNTGVHAAGVRVVEGADRELELARMLGGTDTDAALAHARDLLTAARG